MKITNINPTIETITVTHADGRVTVITDVVAVEYGTLPLATPLHYVDCNAVPADLDALQRIIARDGRVKVRVKHKSTGAYHNLDAVAYYAAPQFDDLLLDDGRLISEYYWSNTWPVALNPTRVARAIYGYWE